MRVIAIFSCSGFGARGVSGGSVRVILPVPAPKRAAERWARQEQRKPAPAPEAPRMQTRTNPPAESSEGFYVGKGDQRVYVKYATPDPVLRSFLQSVMDGSADPNVKGRELFMTICAACHQQRRRGQGWRRAAAGRVGVGSGAGRRPPGAHRFERHDGAGSGARQGLEPPHAAVAGEPGR